MDLFENLTQRIELLKVWLKALNPLFHYESTNRTHFSNMSQRIEPFFEYDSKNWFFFEYWLKELNFFECDAKNWTFFLGYDAKIDPFSPKFWQKKSKNWTFFSKVTQRIEYDSKDWTFFQCDSKNSIFELFLQIWLTLRVQPICTFSYDSTNWTYFTWLKELNLIELSLKELNLLFNDTKNWTSFFFLKRLNELNIFCDPKNWTFFCWMWPKELNHCWKTWRIDPFYQNDWELNPFWTFSYDSKKWTFFEMTQRIKHFWMWLKELKFFNMTLTELNISFLEYDAQNWTSLFSNMTHRIEHLISSRIWLTELNPFFSKWLKEVNFLFDKIWPKGLIFSDMTQRTENFFECDSKHWPFFFFFLKKNMIQRIEPSSQKDSKNWFFHNFFQRFEPFLTWVKENDSFFVWLKDFLLFCKMYDSKNELIVLGKYDSENWNFWKKNGL